MDIALYTATMRLNMRERDMCLIHLDFRKVQDILKTLKRFGAEHVVYNVSKLSQRLVVEPREAIVEWNPMSLDVWRMSVINPFLRKGANVFKKERVRSVALVMLFLYGIHYR